MKALSLWQPWATLLTTGHKRCETRSWPLSHRGPLLIHAAKKWDGTLQDICLSKHFRECLKEFGVPPSPHSWNVTTRKAAKMGFGMTFGAIIGRVDVVDCLPTGEDGFPCLSEQENAFGDFSHNRFAFFCENPVLFHRPRGKMMSNDILTIRMQTPGFGMGEPCVACGKPSSGFHGLPVFNGDIMSNDWPGEWGGQVCCESCYNKHERGEMLTADHLYQHLFLNHFIDGAGI